MSGPGEIDALLPDDLSPSVIFASAPPTTPEIIASVCAHYNVDPATLTIGTDRTTSLCRMLTCLLSREINRTPVKDLAPIVKRHESNISNLLNKVAGRLAADELLRDDIDIIKRRLAHTITQRKMPCH